MNKTKATKRALLMSMLSMLICIAMLIGSTFAWFTDSVTSGRNKIVAGNLDIELYRGTGTEDADKVTKDTMLFQNPDGTNITWEPGVVIYENFTVKNVGSLALKYSLALNVVDKNFVKDTTKSLADVVKVAFLNKHFTGDRTEAQALTDYKPLENTAKTGTLLPEEKDETRASEQFAIVLYWQPGEHDNDYNLNNGKESDDGEPLFIQLGVDLNASQYTYESDSFDERYDADATGDDNNVITLTSVEKEATTDELTNEPLTFVFDNTAPLPAESKPASTTVEFEAGALNGTSADDKHTVELSIETKFENDTATTGGLVNVAYIDLSLIVDGDEVHYFAADKYATVTTYIQTGLDDVKVLFNDVALDAANVKYDSTSGKLTFKTNHFSKYVVQGVSATVNVPDFENSETMLNTLKNVLGQTRYLGKKVTVTLPECTDESKILDMSGDVGNLYFASQYPIEIDLNGWTVYSNGSGGDFKIGDYNDGMSEGGSHFAQKVNVTVLDGIFKTEGNRNPLVTIGERSKVTFKDCRFISDGAKAEMIHQEVGLQKREEGSFSIAFDGCYFEKCYASFNDTYFTNDGAKSTALGLTYTNCRFELNLSNTKTFYNERNRVFAISTGFATRANINMTGCEINYTGYNSAESSGDSKYALCKIDYSVPGSSYNARVTTVNMKLENLTINGEGVNNYKPAPFCPDLRTTVNSTKKAIDIKTTGVVKYNYNNSDKDNNQKDYWDTFKMKNRS